MRERAPVAEAELIGLAPRAAFEGFPEDVPLRGFSPERHILEGAPPKGAFYAFPWVEGVLGRELRGRRPRSAMELAELLLEEARVAIVPGEAFGAPGYARLSYALGDDDLAEGIGRIAKLLEEAW